MKKNFFQSKTCWGALLLTVGIGVEAFGYGGASTTVVQALGTGGTIWGIRDAL